MSKHTKPATEREMLYWQLGFLRGLIARLTAQLVLVERELEHYGDPHSHPGSN